MTMTTSGHSSTTRSDHPVDNGVNTAALLAARDALVGSPRPPSSPGARPPHVGARHATAARP